MTPAQTEKLTTAIEPFWARLRDCLIKARAQAASLPAHATRADIAHVRAWIFVLESLLRRLVLIAATGVETGIQPRWRRKERTAHSNRKPRKRGQRKRYFRVYGRRAAKRASRRPTRNRRASSVTRQSAIPPEMTPQEFMDWSAEQARTGAITETSGQAAARQMKDAERALEKPRRTAEPRNIERNAVERRSEPDSAPTAAWLERLAFIAQLILNPEPLIQRAAIAMARAREIAYEQSLVAVPKARGLLKASPLMFSLLIPLHHGFSEAMNLFALSYIEPDTS